LKSIEKETKLLIITTRLIWLNKLNCLFWLSLLFAIVNNLIIMSSKGPDSRRQSLTPDQLCLPINPYSASHFLPPLPQFPDFPTDEHEAYLVRKVQSNRALYLNFEFQYCCLSSTLKFQDWHFGSKLKINFNTALVRLIISKEYWHSLLRVKTLDVRPLITKEYKKYTTNFYGTCTAIQNSFKFFIYLELLKPVKFKGQKAYSFLLFLQI
jgi:hypothetical protein